MFFKGDNKSILENNNNVFKKALSNSFQIEKIDLKPCFFLFFVLYICFYIHQMPFTRFMMFH